MVLILLVLQTKVKHFLTASRLSVFKKSADYCVKYCRKGDLVAVEGELNIYKNETKTYVSCAVSRIQNCSSKKQSQGDDVILEKDNIVSEPNDIDIDDDNSLPF